MAGIKVSMIHKEDSEKIMIIRVMMKTMMIENNAHVSMHREGIP